MPVKTVAIVGAGVAGMTAALAFAQRGIRSNILEQARELGEVGAGLQISPNAAHILNDLGILQSLEKVWLEPQAIRLTSGITLKTLASVPSGPFARDRWKAPYGVLHRATLQKALLDAVLDHPLSTLHLGTPLDSDRVDGIAALCGEQPDLTVGADGVWSQVRNRIPGAPSAQFSGNIAWRFLLPEEEKPDFIDDRNVTAFLGPRSHLVCYPLKEARSVNLVAITSGSNPGMKWQEKPGERQIAHFRRQFSGWHPSIQQAFDGPTAPTFWPLYEAGNGTWQNGHDTVLIGDAAHAMMPFAAQGAAMAIEDAYELAAFVAAMPVTEALKSYEDSRKSRAARLKSRAVFNKFAYHARGPIRLARDFVLSLRPPQSLAADLDWIYGYRIKP